MMTTTAESERVPYSAWGVSLGLHALIVGLAFMITARVQPILKEEMFQWEVALVQPSPDAPRTESPQSTPTVQPPKPSPVRTVQTAQPVPPVEPASDMVMTRVATPYSPEIVHPTIAPPKPEIQPEVVQAKVQPVEPQETKKEEIKKEEVKPQEILKPEPVVHEQQPVSVAREVSPPVEAVAAAQAYEPPSPSHSRHAESVPVIHHESPSPEEAAPEWRPLVAVRERSAQAMPAPAAASSAPAVAESTAVAAAPVQAPPHHADAPVVANAASVRPATKADNAWLGAAAAKQPGEYSEYRGAFSRGIGICSEVDIGGRAGIRAVASEHRNDQLYGRSGCHET